MYLHQVVDDMRENSGLSGDKVNKNISRLRAAQCFHFHNYEESLEILGLDDPEIRDELTQDFSYMPFPVCWFDFTECFGGRLGLLVGKMRLSKDRASDNGFLVHPFAQFPLKGNGRLQWSEMPFFLEVYINRERDENFPPYTINVETPWEDNDFIEWLETWKHICDDPETYGEIAMDIGLVLNIKGLSTKVVKSPEKLNKKRQKKGKSALFDYKVLTVKVPGTACECHVSGGASKNRMHLRRGSVARYKYPKLLFGKLEGLFYRKPCIAGSNKNGIVMKDYEVKPEREDE